MSLLEDGLLAAASGGPQIVALEDANRVLTYGKLVYEVENAGARMRACGLRTLGLLADNGIAWAVADLAAVFADIPLVPVPLFFSPRQMLHVIGHAGIEGLLTDRPGEVLSLLSAAGIQARLGAEIAGLRLVHLPDIETRPLPAGTAKITYTSGTTGEPKGVCLSRAQIESVASSLKEASGAVAKDRHLCLTPLATLLENIGGLYVPLLAGARVSVLPLRAVGLRGASALNVAQMLQAMRDSDASSAILAPQMLQAMVAAAASGAPLPPSLRFVAVGGAPVSLQLLERAGALGIPVFEGYGLSECASVVALNTPDANRPGSVGRPLPHVQLNIAEDGEIMLASPGFLGYLGQPAVQQPWPTGDLGYLDEAGFLHISGRKKSLFITAFGRNVAPEWIERELALSPAIAQAAVFGEARPFNVAVIVPRPGVSPADIEAAIGEANATLPDYARIPAWLAASAAFSPENGQLTANGRLKRSAIAQAYQAGIEELYAEAIHAIF